MTKKYRIVEEVTASGLSTFYIQSKKHFLDFWRYEKSWKSGLNYRGKIRKPTKESAELEIAHLKRQEVEIEKSLKDSRVVKVKYHKE